MAEHQLIRVSYQRLLELIAQKASYNESAFSYLEKMGTKPPRGKEKEFFDQWKQFISATNRIDEAFKPWLLFRLQKLIS